MPIATKRNPTETRQKLVAATLRLMLRQGFSATTVDEICAEAGMTKGSFFHHFETKEAIGHAALDRFAQIGMDLYSAAWKDPGVPALNQLHQLFDIMIGFVAQPDEPVVCMVGMLSQEMSQTHPDFREACSGHLTVWADMVIRLLDEAKRTQLPTVEFDSEEVAWFLNSLWQGSMLIGKTRQNPQLIINNLQRARAYVDGLFASPIPDLLTDRDFVINRTFAAPASLVFKAWIDPQWMAQWWGPRNFTNPVCDLNVLPGGQYRIVMRSAEGTEYPVTGIYREIAKPTRLVITMDCTGHPPEWHDLVNPRRTADETNPAGVFTSIATFEEHNGKTKLTVRLHFDSVAIRHALLKLGMNKGWSESLDRLAELLAKESSTSL